MDNYESIITRVTPPKIIITTEYTGSKPMFQTKVNYKLYADFDITVQAHNERRQARLGHDEFIRRMTQEPLPASLLSISNNVPMYRRGPAISIYNKEAKPVLKTTIGPIEIVTEKIGVSVSYHTSILHPTFSNFPIFVQIHKTIEDAAQGHRTWVLTMSSDHPPTMLVDVYKVKSSHMWTYSTEQNTGNAGDISTITDTSTKTTNISATVEPLPSFYIIKNFGGRTKKKCSKTERK